MIENETKHTFIVTVDRKTALTALKDEELLRGLTAILDGLGMTRANLVMSKPDGVYYSVTHKR